MASLYQMNVATSFCLREGISMGYFDNTTNPTLEVFLFNGSIFRAMEIFHQPYFSVYKKANTHILNAGT